MKQTVITNELMGPNGVLYAAEGATVSQERLEDLLNRGIISFEEYFKCSTTASDTDKTKAFLSYSVDKTIPCASDTMKKEVEELLTNLSSNKNTARAIGCLGRRSLWSYEHSLRVAILSAAMGQKLDLTENELAIMSEGAIVHDVGKIFFTDLVEKHGTLTPEEYDLMKEHTKAGYRFLIGAGFSQEVALVALLHHERRNGKGYWGIKDIPKSIEIVSFADSMEAMNAPRPYKNGMEMSAVLESLAKDYLTCGIYSAEMIAEARKLTISVLKP